ncbi:MAG TPA: PH domain-containing protein [Vicinamibacterales bacterium]
MSDAEPVADGVDHPLDPRLIPVQRIGGAAFYGVFALGSFIALNVMDQGLTWPRFAVWLTVVIAAAWHAWSWPPVAWRHTSYRVDDQGIEIRRGVYWRLVINVPRSRVQHIDVAQGPLERRYGLGTLVVYTAGTDHAKVELEGLAHARALRIREHLLPSETADAV